MTGEDKIYDKEITYENIKDNPILQPISEIKSNYESHSLMVIKSTIEFDNLYKEINETIKLNPVYSETIIIGDFKELIRNAKDIIHSQDLQREMMKQAITKMIDIVNRYYEAREKKDYIPTEIVEKRGRTKRVPIDKAFEDLDVENGKE